MCLELAQRRTDLRLEMIVLANMAYNRILKNDYTTSLNLSQRAEVLAQRIDEKRFQASIKGNLGYAYWQLGYYQMGEVYYREHLKLSYEQGIMDNFVENLFELSGFWKHMNFDRQAQILWEIAENLRLYYNYAIFHNYENIKLQVFGKITPTQPDGNVSIYQQDLVAALQRGPEKAFL